ncbi:MAG: hypothetical protein KatS3mg065_0887 [Chloroflexota bacterium]|nr:MAG: hypothetical protein KatS3mg065_0887 [Chloroflexota bacterium]
MTDRVQRPASDRDRPTDRDRADRWFERACRSHRRSALGDLRRRRHRLLRRPSRLRHRLRHGRPGDAAAEPDAAPDANGDGRHGDPDEFACRLALADGQPAVEPDAAGEPEPDRVGRSFGRPLGDTDSGTDGDTHSRAEPLAVALTGVEPKARAGRRPWGRILVA